MRGTSRHCPTAARRSLPALVLLLVLASPGLATVPPGASGGSPFPDAAERAQLLRRHRAGGLPRSGAVNHLRGHTPARARTGEATQATQDDFDVRHVRLEVDVTDTRGKLVRGAATEVVASNVASLSQVMLNLIKAMVVDTVRVDGVTASFTHPQDLLTIDLPSPLAPGQTASIRIAYHGKPPQDGRGLIFDRHDNQDFIWSFCEPDLARRWWPCKDRPDDKADSLLVILTVPGGLTATSNGLLQSAVAGPAGSMVFTWRETHPIASYLISLAAGDFQRLDDVYPIPGGGTMPITSYVFPEQASHAATDFSIAGEVLDALGERFGTYPFVDEKYGVTVFGWDGAMEHQTNTSYSGLLITGIHYFDYVYVHELGHQWWGDNVTCATWPDLWLNEGFASWCEALWYEHQGGFASYHNYMVNVLTVSDPSGPVYGDQDLDDVNTVYDKGAWVLHMLRGVLGDEVFFPAMRDYRASYEGGSATTAQFRAAMEASSETDLAWFFDEWLDGVNRPQYVVSTFSEPHLGGQRVYVHLDQIQTNAPFFTMPVRIRVSGGTTQDRVLWNDPDHADLVADVATTPVTVTVDPDNWILRTVTTGPYHLNLITADLPDVHADSPFSDTLVARGGTPPYTWQALDPLPPGITLGAQSGVLEGTPTSPGSYDLRIRVQASSQTDTQHFTWTILSPSVAVANVPGDTAPGLSVTPNPAVGSVLLSVPPGTPGAAHFSVFDLAGRAVAHGTSAEQSASANRTWRWDARGTGGRPLPPGLYLVRAIVGPKGGNHALNGKLLLLGR